MTLGLQWYEVLLMGNSHQRTWMWCIKGWGWACHSATWNGACTEPTDSVKDMHDTNYPHYGYIWRPTGIEETSCQSINLPSYSSIYLNVKPSIARPIQPYNWLHKSLYLTMYMSIYPSIHSTIHVSFYLLIYLSIWVHKLFINLCSWTIYLPLNVLHHLCGPYHMCHIRHVHRMYGHV